MNELQLIESKEMRNNVCGRVEVLDKVKQVVTFSNTEFSTIELASNFYEVELNTIKTVISRNKEELKEDGLKVYKYKEVKEILQTVENTLMCQIPARGLTLIPKRALLKIGLLLNDSKVAIKLREELGISNARIRARKEIDFLNIIEPMVEKAGYTMYRQFTTLSKYRIDAYIPEINIAIEYDELQHEYNYSKDDLRQKRIEKELGCKFIRISERDDYADAIVKIALELLE